MLPTVLMLLATAGARAEEGDEGQAKSWLRDRSPALNVEFGIHAQELKAAGATTFGARDSGTNTVSTLFARIEAGVASPPIDFMPGKPRLFLRGGGSIPLRETGATIISSQRIQGAEFGTDLSASFKDMWHAGVDLRFLLPIPNQTILIRPGFEYLQSRFRFEPDAWPVQSRTGTKRNTAGPFDRSRARSHSGAPLAALPALPAARPRLRRALRVL